MSVEFESTLKDRYAELCDKNDKEDGMSNNDSSNSRDSDDEIIDRYDGFACDGIITAATNKVGA